MRISDEIVECVVFLAYTDKGIADPEPSEYRFGGTAFLFSIPMKNRAGALFGYLVTAKHCVVQAIERDLNVFVRLNTHHGGSEFVRADGHWFLSDDTSVDIAVLPFAPSAEKYRFKYIDHSMLGDETKLAEHGIGIGEELVVSGLFTRRSGRQKNLPIVRFGNLAAMPSEPIPDGTSGLGFHAYLVEVRSIGGLSGSPVFAYLGPGRIRPHDGTINLGKSFLILIGVIRGHWEHQEQLLGMTTVFRDELDRVNWGIAVVTPAQELKRILFEGPLAEMRRGTEQEVGDTPGH